MREGALEWGVIMLVQFQDVVKTYGAGEALFVISRTDEQIMN